jgi:hypothetical protein
MTRKARHANSEGQTNSTLSTPPKLAWPFPPKKYYFLIFLFMLIIAAKEGQSLSTPIVSISPVVNATTVQDLTCIWSVSGAETVTVAWYNNSALFNSSSSVESPWVLPNSRTRKGQSWNCTVVATNASAAPSSRTGSAKVEIINAAPIQPYLSTNEMGTDSLGTYIVIQEELSYTYYMITNDPDADTLFYSVSPSDNYFNYCSVVSTTGVVTCHPEKEPNISVNDIFHFQVHDGTNSVGIFVSFNVTPFNDPPTFVFPTPKNVSINDTQRLHYFLNVTDEEHPNGPFNFSVNSSFGDSRIVYNTTNHKRFTIMFEGNRTANFYDTGNWTIWVRACDPANSSLCVNDSFNLEVRSTNHPPNITGVENKTGIQNEPYEIFVNATDFNQEDTLNFSVSAPACALRGIANPWMITTLVSTANASARINATSLTNYHIACRNITITVRDNKNAAGTRNLMLNLLNVNDPPVINNISTDSRNSHNNKDISNLRAYSGLPFFYRINATDIDYDLWVAFNRSVEYLDLNDSLTYSVEPCIGCPTLTLNATSGVVTFMPNLTYLDTYYYTVTITDSYGLFNTSIMTIQVIENQMPYFIHPLQDKTAWEGVRFLYKINATDPEDGFVRFTLNPSMLNSAIINISSSGLINFTPTCYDVGNYSIEVKINDSWGAENISSFNLEVRMTPNAPYFLANLTQRVIPHGIPFYFDVSTLVVDPDIVCGQPDNLTFTSRFLSNNTFFNITDMGIISFTSQEENIGNYLINISVIDSYGLSASLRWNLTVVNRTNPPVITNITPYGIPTIYGWISPALLGSNITSIRISENTTTVFNHTSVDPDGNELRYNWSINGIYAGNQTYLSKDWDFFSSGLHNVTLTVSDVVNGTLANHVRFTWNTTVSNVNRPPTLNSSLPNVTVNGTITIASYLSGQGWGAVRFTDPDGDVLTYNNTPVTRVQIEFAGDSVIIRGKELGAEDVVFTASDGEYSVSSNVVTLIVTHIEQRQSSGTDTQTNTRSTTQYVPYTVLQEIEKERETYLDILAPEPVVIYNNNTLRQVINIVNRANITLRGIHLSATTNSTDAQLTFSTSYFPDLLPGETQKTDLIVSGYRILNNYEIVVWANVSEPVYKDKAVIYVNALERTRGNQSVTATKITFARDLLSANPECMELGEYLRRAQNFMDQRDYQSASDMLDEVIQGCKHLVSQSRLRDERPQYIILGVDFNTPYLKTALALFFILTAAAVVMTIRLKKSNEKEPE